MKKTIVIAILSISIAISILPLWAQTKNTVPAQNAEEEQDESTETLKEEALAKSNKKGYGEFSLGAIVVKAKAVADIEDSSTTTEITALDIEARSDKLLADTLKMVPGIQISTRQKGNKQFYMRGYDMDKVALLIDGIPVTDAYGRNMDIDNIGVMNISRIVVNRGVTSALYGTRGVVGSINMITKKPTEMYTELNAEYGQFRNYVLSAAHGAPIGNLYYWICAQYDKSEGYEVSKSLDRKKREMWIWKLSRYDYYGFSLADLYFSNKALRAYLDDTGKWDHTNHEKYKISGKIGYEFNSRFEAGVSAMYNNTVKKNSSYSSRMTYQYTPETMAWVESVASDALKNMSSHWPEYYSLTVAPYARYEVNDFCVKGIIHFYEQSNTLEAFKDPYEIIRSWNLTTETAVWSIWTSQSYGVNLYPSWKIASWNKLNAAVSFNYDNHTKKEEAQKRAVDVISLYGNDVVKTQFIETRSLTLALEDEIKIDDIEITAGISYDAQDLTEYKKKEDVDGSTKMVDQYQAKDDSMVWGTRDSFNPVIGIVYEAMKDFLKLRAAGAIKTQFPSLSAYSYTGSALSSSPNKGSKDVVIEPERSINSNLGFELFFRNKTINFRTDYFFSKYDDKIERVWDRYADDHIYINIDSALVHGAETSVESSFENLLNLFDINFTLSYTYIHSRNQADKADTEVNMGEKFEETPEHQFIFDIRTDFKTDTSLIIFGYTTLNQIKYTMKSIPPSDAPFSTDYFYEQELHDPIMVNIKVSQTILNNFDIYVMCKNVLDDYDADPLNPGPGRMWHIGGKATF